MKCPECGRGIQAALNHCFEKSRKAEMSVGQVKGARRRIAAKDKGHKQKSEAEKAERKAKQKGGKR